MLLEGAREFAGAQSQRCPKYWRKTFLTVLFLAAILVPQIECSWNPYEVLGVRRDANAEQIKRAYRDLARKFHPDKTSTSENDAGKRFIEINKAFDILKDTTKRARYDQQGIVDEGRQARGYHHGGSAHQTGHRRSGGTWFFHDGRTFTFYTGGGPDSYFRRNSINSRQYFNEFMRDSKQKPFLIFFYADPCHSCYMLEPRWIEITNELAKYNVGAFAINVQMELRLAHELGVSSIPLIACLLDGHLHHFNEREVSQTSIVKFIKNLLPDNLVPLLRTVDAQDRHMDQKVAQKSRLSAIIINDEKNLKLRYLLLAYSLRQYYRFGHVSTKSSEYKMLAKRYNLELGSQTHILAFDERLDRPRVHIRFDSEKFSQERCSRDLLAWPFLQLPKLWSQQIFDDLCLYAIPKEGERVEPRLCVILFSSSTPSSLPARDEMLEFIELNRMSQDRRVVFAHIDPQKQIDFVKSLIIETSSTRAQSSSEVEFSILFIKRQSENGKKARYHWLTNRWDPSQPDQLDRAKIEAHNLIMKYRQGTFEPQGKLLLTTLMDEEGPNLMQRIFARFYDGIRRTIQYLTSRQSFSTVIILMGCVLLTSLFLYKSPVPTHYTSQESDFQYYRSTPTNEPMKSERTTNSSQVRPTYQDMIIRELKAETYNGMLRSLKPGFRTIIVLTDAQSSEKLLDSFKRAVWPYRKNRTLMFAYLSLDKNLDWFKQLLECILGCEGLKVNKKNCIGTVLSLNGFRKYFRVYHAKHHEIDYYDDETDDGSFLGFNEDDDDGAHPARDPELGVAQNAAGTSHGAEIYTVDNLLDKLPIWLDKMFDGLTKRYFVDDWPEEMN